MLPFKIRAIAPLYFNDYAARIFSRHFSTCKSLCRRTTLSVYLKGESI